jgi:hypothetical protein
MRLSTRFLLPAAGLALACGAIVWPRWLAPDRAETCARPEVLSVTGLIPGTHPGGERRTRLSADVIQWSEGSIPDELLPRDPLVFRIVRSYAVLKTAEHPLGLMPARVEAEIFRRELVDAPGGPLPVHVVRSSGHDKFHVVAYAFVFGNEPVENPFLAQLRGTLRELRNGRRPLTVLLAGGMATPETAAHREALALRWIAAAWEHYRGMCFDGRLPSRGSAPALGGGAPP